MKQYLCGRSVRHGLLAFAAVALWMLGDLGIGAVASAAVVQVAPLSQVERSAIVIRLQPQGPNSDPRDGVQSVNSVLASREFLDPIMGEALQLKSGAWSDVVTVDLQQAGQSGTRFEVRVSMAPGVPAGAAKQITSEVSKRLLARFNEPSEVPAIGGSAAKKAEIEAEVAQLQERRDVLMRQLSTRSARERSGQSVGRLRERQADKMQQQKAISGLVARAESARAGVVAAAKAHVERIRGAIDASKAAGNAQEVLRYQVELSAAEVKLAEVSVGVLDDAGSALFGLSAGIEVELAGLASEIQRLDSEEQGLSTDALMKELSALEREMRGKQQLLGEVSGQSSIEQYRRSRQPKITISEEIQP
jgi:hypothetical protein